MTPPSDTTLRTWGQGLHDALGITICKHGVEAWECCKELPDYLNDRNAVARLEAALSKEQHREYVYQRMMCVRRSNPGKDTISEWGLLDVQNCAARLEAMARFVKVECRNCPNDELIPCKGDADCLITIYDVVQSEERR